MERGALRLPSKKGERGKVLHGAPAQTVSDRLGAGFVLLREGEPSAVESAPGGVVGASVLGSALGGDAGAGAGTAAGAGMIVGVSV